MIITAKDIMEYLEAYCDDLQCPSREIEACSNECPVAIACMALNKLNGDVYAYEIKESSGEETYNDE